MCYTWLGISRGRSKIPHNTGPCSRIGLGKTDSSTTMNYLTLHYLEIFHEQNPFDYVISPSSPQHSALQDYTHSPAHSLLPGPSIGRRSFPSLANPSKQASNQSNQSNQSIQPIQSVNPTNPINQASKQASKQAINQASNQSINQSISSSHVNLKQTQLQSPAKQRSAQELPPRV